MGIISGFIRFRKTITKLSREIYKFSNSKQNDPGTAKPSRDSNVLSRNSYYWMKICDII